MLDWLWDNATKVVAFAGLFFGLIGTCLSIWNRIEQWRESRRKRVEREPWAALQIQSPNHLNQWRASVVFTNSTRHQIIISEATLIRPKGYGLMLDASEAMLRCQRHQQ